MMIPFEKSRTRTKFLIFMIPPVPFGMSAAGRHATTCSYTQDDNEQKSKILMPPPQDQDLSGEQCVDDDEYFAYPLLTSSVYGGQSTPV